jgi:hypothetical protein
MMGLERGRRSTRFGGPRADYRLFVCAAHSSVLSSPHSDDTPQRSTDGVAVALQLQALGARIRESETKFEEHRLRTEMQTKITPAMMRASVQNQQNQQQQQENQQQDEDDEPELEAFLNQNRRITYAVGRDRDRH